MPEYRIDGVTLSGKSVSGSITADSRSIAKIQSDRNSRTSYVHLSRPKGN